MSLQQQEKTAGNDENCTGTSNWTLNTSANSSRASTVCCGGNDGDDQLLKEMKLKMDTLEAKNQMLEGKLENLELKAQNRALKEEAAQQANNTALEEKLEQLKDEFSQILLTQSEQHQKAMAQLEANFSDKVAALRKEMEENGKQAIEDNQSKLDYIWSHLLTKGKLLANPKGIIWSGVKTKASISEFGLKATTTGGSYEYVFASEGFAISGKPCRQDNFPFPGTIVFYYEATSKSNWFETIGFSDGKAGDHRSTNWYAIKRNSSANCYDNADYYDDYWLSGRQHKFEHPAKAANLLSGSDVVGCGLLLNSKNRWAVFFTVNGLLLGKQIPINPMVDRLYPTVYASSGSVFANFGDNLGVKPFKFDIYNCPGLVFE